MAEEKAGKAQKTKPGKKRVGQKARMRMTSARGGKRKGAGRAPARSVDAFCETPDGQEILREAAPKVLQRMVEIALGSDPTLAIKAGRIILNKVYPDVQKSEVRLDASEALQGRIDKTLEHLFEMAKG
jgi:hypothetical protein